MVNHCANPACCKPLHYLREGRVFIFEMPDPLAVANGSKAARRNEHFWLCGACADGFTLEQKADRNIRMSPLTIRQRRAPVAIMPTAIAS